jgi:hypothetical protein
MDPKSFFAATKADFQAEVQGLNCCLYIAPATHPILVAVKFNLLCWRALPQRTPDLSQRGNFNRFQHTPIEFNRIHDLYAALSDYSEFRHHLSSVQDSIDL